MKPLNINNEEYTLKLKLKTIILFAFLFYLISMILLKYLYFYFFQAPGNEIYFNFDLLRGITGISLKFILYNIISFIPAGIFYKLSTGKSIVKIVLVLFFSFALEILQALMKMGIFDITTVFFNIIGFLAGIFVFIVFKNVKN